LTPDRARCAGILGPAIRQFIYNRPVKADINALIEADVVGFLTGMMRLAPVETRKNFNCAASRLNLSKT
jgi:hypothetical protein